MLSNSKAVTPPECWAASHRSVLNCDGRMGKERPRCSSRACHLTFGCTLGLQRSFKTLQTWMWGPPRGQLSQHLWGWDPEAWRGCPMLCYILPAAPLPACCCFWALMMNLPYPRYFWFGSHCGCPMSSSFKMSEGSVGSLTRDNLFHDLFNQMNFCLYLIHVHWHFCSAFRWKGPWEKS